MNFLLIFVDFSIRFADCSSDVSELSYEFSEFSDFCYDLSAYVFLVLIGFDSIAFHWLHRAEGTMAVWVSYQGVYERGVCQIGKTHGYGDFSVLSLLYSLCLNLYFNDKVMIHLPLLVPYGVRKSNSFSRVQDL